MTEQNDAARTIQLQQKYRQNRKYLKFYAVLRAGTLRLRVRLSRSLKDSNLSSVLSAKFISGAGGGVMLAELLLSSAVQWQQYQRHT